ncbi:MAG: histidine ammonia-lyase [bacterium]
MVVIGDGDVTLAEIEDIAMGRKGVELAAGAKARVQRAAEYVREMAHSGVAVYGVTTGFGANRDRTIRPQDAEILQERLIMSHACGVGAPLPEDVVRAMIALRIAALVQGNSGIRWETLSLLVAMLNNGIHPVVPRFGSVGASGDLCPLAHMCLPLIGLGEVIYKNRKMSSAEAMEAAGLSATRLTYKEGLALLNGTQAMTALGVVVTRRFRRLLDAADLVGAMSLDAVGGRLEALDPRVHALRRRDGQMKSAQNVRAHLTGSHLAGATKGAVEGKTEFVQDSYCLRCMPQVHGASRDVLTHVEHVLHTEANAVTDNPLVFVPMDDEPGAILSGGNFHGQPVAMALDYLKIAVAEIGNVSERRSAKLTDRHFSEGLPPFLVAEPGLNSGMMIPQYVAAALVSENKHRAHPASVDSIPTSANMEDHVSMGTHAGVHALEMIENAERIVAIEYMIAAQALDLRTQPCGKGTGAARDILRASVPSLDTDRVMYVDIEASLTAMRSEAFHAIASQP